MSEKQEATKEAEAAASTEAGNGAVESTKGNGVDNPPTSIGKILDDFAAQLIRRDNAVRTIQKILDLRSEYWNPSFDEGLLSGIQEESEEENNVESLEFNSEPGTSAGASQTNVRAKLETADLKPSHPYPSNEKQCQIQVDVFYTPAIDSDDE